jgi:hypothetical protein
LLVIKHGQEMAGAIAAGATSVRRRPRPAGLHRDEHAREVSEPSRYPDHLAGIGETVLKPSRATVGEHQARDASATTEGALCEFL